MLWVYGFVGIGSLVHGFMGLWRIIRDDDEFYNEVENIGITESNMGRAGHQRSY